MHTIFNPKNLKQNGDVIVMCLCGRIILKSVLNTELNFIYFCTSTLQGQEEGEWVLYVRSEGWLALRSVKLHLSSFVKTSEYG
jgi:hypothetical protein